MSRGKMVWTVSIAYFLILLSTPQRQNSSHKTPGKKAELKRTVPPPSSSGQTSLKFSKEPAPYNGSAKAAAACYWVAKGKCESNPVPSGNHGKSQLSPIRPQRDSPVNNPLGPLLASVTERPYGGREARPRGWGSLRRFTLAMHRNGTPAGVARRRVGESAGRRRWGPAVDEIRCLVTGWLASLCDFACWRVRASCPPVHQ